MNQHLQVIQASAIPPPHWSGRWMRQVASWSSASLTFLFSGTKLMIRSGPQTERKDKDNGGTPMIAVITGPNEEMALKEKGGWKTFDPKPDSYSTVFDEEEGGGKVHDRTYVRIVLIDWASKFDLSALVVDHNASIELPKPPKERIPQILAIGDSIISAMAVPAARGGEPIPYGILDGYLFVAQRLLLQKDPVRKVDVELVAYPGINLVTPTEEEKAKELPPGMCDLFFQKSFWDKDAFMPNLSPTAILIALGTNDQCFEIPKERYGQALSDFIQRLRTVAGPSLRQIWLVPPFPDADTTNRELNDAYANHFIAFLNEKNNTGLTFKLCDLVEGLTVKDTVDGCHPKLEVHGRIGRKLADFIEREFF